MTRNELASYIDLTNVYADATTKDIIKLCKEAIKYNLRSVCVNMGNLLNCVKLLQGTKILKAVVIDYPLGAGGYEDKASQSIIAKQLGANEIDPVINIGKCREILNKTSTALPVILEIEMMQDILPAKVIIETGYWTNKQIATITEIVGDAGAFCIKTSTSCSAKKNINNLDIKAKQIEVMKNTIEKNNFLMHIKAAGGISTYDDTMKMINAGADIIGASKGEQILNGCPS